MTDIRKVSFTQRTVTAWNDVPDNEINANSIKWLL